MPKKTNPDENPQAYIQAARRQIVRSAIFAVAALAVIVFACYAWFAGNHSVSGTIGSIQMLGSLYELAGNGSSKEDSGYGVFYEKAKPAFEFNALPAGDFSTENWPYLESTDSNQSIRWRLNDNSQVGNFGSSTGIRPGSSGILQFYVVPKVAGTLSLSFQLELRPLTDAGALNTEKTINNLIKGHLLFYLENEKSEKLWVSWDGDTFRWQFGVADETAVGKPQLVTLHWMWPENLSNLIPEFSEKIPGYRDLLFYTETGSIPTEEQIKAAVAGNQLDELTKLYNRADRYIGSNLNWLEVKLSAQLAS